MRKQTILSWLPVLLFTAVSVVAGEDDFLKPVGRPPKAKPQRRQGGEAMPPLPLPATPLRRSEKKRPPSPATLIGKVIWGNYLDYTWKDGNVSRVYDWNMVPADCQQLLRTAKTILGVEYKAESVALDTFNTTPAEMPVLYFSGGRGLKFTDADREKLRNYMRQGGMIWFDSCVGSPYFYKSAVIELAKIIPESPLVRLPPDHPVFHMVDDATVASVRTRKDIAPVLDGVYIGSRLAAVVSPYGLGASWDKTDTSLIPDANFYDRKSATVLGLNLVAYSIGYFRVAQSFAKADVYRTRDTVKNNDALVFTQIQTTGVWNTEPGGAGNLLRFLNRNLNIEVSYKIKSLRLGEDTIERTPFLYLSGITTFTFSPKERAAVAAFVHQGGFLLIDNALGLSEFDAAARRELATIFKGVKLERLPVDHSLFTAGPFRVNHVTYTLPAQVKYKNLKSPWLEALAFNGVYQVFYSPFDLAAGWQGDEHPLAYGYASADALRLGTNLVTYFMTH